MDLQGHRGARGHRPENTRAAFQLALAEGMTTIELDTTLTSDGHLVVHHDVNTNPTLCTAADGTSIVSQPVRSMTMAELRKLNCGSSPNPKFPEQVLSTQNLLSLKEFFEFIAQQTERYPAAKTVRFNVEIKFPENVPEADVQGSVNRAVEVIEQAQMVDRSTIQSFVLEALPLVQQQNPNIRRAALFAPTKKQAVALKAGNRAAAKQIIQRATALEVQIISPYHLYVDPQFVSDAHAVGLRVVPWTVNEVPLMLKLMKAGVDGIISDYPDRLNEAYRQHQKNR